MKTNKKKNLHCNENRISMVASIYSHEVIAFMPNSFISLVLFGKIRSKCKIKQYVQGNRSDLIRSEPKWPLIKCVKAHNCIRKSKCVIKTKIEVNSFKRDGRKEREHVSLIKATILSRLIFMFTFLVRVIGPC